VDQQFAVVSRAVVPALNGILVVDKPGGVTSARVVGKVKRVLGVKLGHTGTLDPMATGVLPLCLGEGTKVAGYLLAQDKAYEGELELGVETDTLDAEGEVTGGDRAVAETVDRDALLAAMAKLTGELMQTPPMFSAVKHKGQRLHKLARAGVQVEREARAIRIHEFELLEFSPPRARFRASCSKGTYIRVLVADLGAALGCGAHLTALRRTASGRFTLAQSIQASEITSELAAERLISPAEAIDHLPSLTISPEKLHAVANGQQLLWTDVAGESPVPAGTCRLLTPSLELLALVRVEGGRLRFDRVFSYALT